MQIISKYLYILLVIILIKLEFINLIKLSFREQSFKYCIKLFIYLVIIYPII